MWSCTQCPKTYAYLHKLQHHQTWSCPGKKGTSGVCDLPRRPLSSNIFSLDQEVKEGSDFKDGSDVKEESDVKEGSDEKESKEENECAREDEVSLKVGLFTAFKVVVSLFSCR